ncbi:hypothetical protein E2C01_002612 [Portunus trituberculatus]|uniref:Uncharacterized protein n=1 Tax=Portunus trituberculatus TaxID=210409 RepID=A0A5B7CK77_PORTR|nr:hypothetical protein [Portunus trituberculatus]
MNEDDYDKDEDDVRFKVDIIPCGESEEQREKYFGGEKKVVLSKNEMTGVFRDGGMTKYVDGKVLGSWKKAPIYTWNKGWASQRMVQGTETTGDSYLAPTPDSREKAKGEEKVSHLQPMSLFEFIVPKNVVPTNWEMGDGQRSLPLPTHRTKSQLLWKEIGKGGHGWEAVQQVLTWGRPAGDWSGIGADKVGKVLQG